MIPVDTLMEESKCYLCLGITQAEALELALLNRIAEGSGGVAPGVLVYRALLDQTGASPPTAIVLQNSLGVTPTFGYSGGGQYTLTATGALTLNKTAVSFGDNTASFSALTVNGFSIGSWDLTIPSQTDDVFRRQLLQILVYP